MKKSIIAAIIVAVIAITGGIWFAVGGGSSSKPDLVACKAAINAQLEASVNAVMVGLPAPDASKPKACNGLSDKQLAAVADQIMNAG